MTAVPFSLYFFMPSMRNNLSSEWVVWRQWLVVWAKPNKTWLEAKQNRDARRPMTVPSSMRNCAHQ
jgi:hypothetical protein